MSRRTPIILVSALAASLAGLPLVHAQAAETPVLSDPLVKESATGSYIVQLDDAPVAEYDGDIAGLPSTRVDGGGKLVKTDAPVTSYVQHLSRERDEVLKATPDAKKLYDYNYTYSGFSAEMSYDDAVKLAKSSGVKSVEPSGMQHQDTVDTPRFLGLSGKGGTWQQVGGIDKAGDGVIIGVIDGGFTPERPSFAPIKTTKKSDALVAKKWKGICQAGEEAPLVTCNNKVIGARYFNKGIGTRPIPEEFTSPRDFGGHGTHTASTAAGNYGVDMTVLGRDYGKGSGMAPHARLAIYKALWSVDAAGGGSGTDADIIAAIDTAVADGVDVINYSISGTGATYFNTTGMAFMRAAKAGVFVAVSAGNTGPGVSTVGKTYPWVTTVANGTHDRDIQTTVTLGDGSKFTGAGIGSGTPSSPVVLAKDAGLPGANPANLVLCQAGTLDPAKATGKIVVCDRGGNARVDKSAQVKAVGGIGMILVNIVPGTLDADLHTVPSVHLDDKATPTVKAYVSGTANPTATISAGTPVKVVAPKVAASSSRGPSLAGNGDLLKPDIMAPGTNVLAATSAFGAAGGEYAFFSGTSMSTPHVAGIAAILKSKHPDWSPMAIKSALATTATTKDSAGQPIQNDSGTPATPFGYGAGMVQPKKVLDPGLVYDSTYADWAKFVCASGEVPTTHELCAGGKIDPSDLNYPTIAVGDLAGKQTITRTVKSVSKLPEVYFPKVTGATGLKVTVSPKVLIALPGKSVTYKVTIENAGAPLEQYSFGTLTWKSAFHAVSSTLAVKPLTVKAPVQVKGTGVSGSAPVSVTAGYTGTLNTTAVGLTAATVTDAVVKKAGGVSFPATNPQANDHVAKFTVAIPAGTKYARFSTFDADYPAATDVDVYVYKSGTTAVLANSGGGSSEEEANLVAPAAGSYDVYIDFFAGADNTTVKLNHWALTTAEGNLTVAPASQPVTTAAQSTVTATWTGLTAGTRYLGQLSFTDGGAGTGSTVLRVDS
ncbi:S8 family serine peptidase [Kribbella antibiotica]|uniref:S8 family serine peptidase n=1 Tax=Kribbella antibiotica TaxID=190195 RepID=UPI001EDF33C3|nr:S8 family serine peptidase [Kribbella antibiotica]